MSTKHDIVKTPMPFPTLPISVAPKKDRTWILNNWWVVFLVETLVIFVVFCALLVYYLCFVRSPGKWVTEDKVGNDGLSRHSSVMDSDSDFGGSQRSFSSHSMAKQSSADDAAPNSVEVRPKGTKRRTVIKRK